MSEKTRDNTLRLVLRPRPVSYRQTAQQGRMKEVAEKCGIRKGITRAELVDKMINCVPEEWRKQS